jgi:hypothetical protein
MTQEIRFIQHLPEYIPTSKSWQTIQGKSADTDISLFYYPYPHLEPPVNFNGLAIASIPDIAAMKLEAISSGGLKRDFFDLYCICQKYNYSLSHIIDLAKTKFSHDTAYVPHYLKSLTYFDDAETKPERAQIVDSQWQQVKEFFKQSAMSINISG